MVVLSACHSEAVGENFVEAGVPHVIAIKQGSRVADEASRTFAESFYLALLHGKTVLEAFDISEAHVLAEEHQKGRDVTGQFLLLPKDDPDHHQVPIFEDLEEGMYEDETLPLPPNACTLPPSPMFGRNSPLHKIVSRLGQEKNRVVTITGESGIGKTALALRSCQYLAERRRVREIFFLDLDDFDTQDIPPLTTFAPLIASALNLPPPPSSTNFDRISLLTQATSSLGKFTIEDGAFLLLVDGGDPFFSHSYDIIPLLDDLLKRIGAFQIIFTSRDSIGHLSSNQLCHPIDSEPEKVIPIGSLDAFSSAQLLVRTAPRNLMLEEMKTDDPSNALNSLSEREVVKALEGHPRAIKNFSKMLDHTQSLSDELISDAIDALWAAREVVRERRRRATTTSSTHSRNPPEEEKDVVEEQDTPVSSKRDHVSSFPSKRAMERARRAATEAGVVGEEVFTNL